MTPAQMDLLARARRVAIECELFFRAQLFEAQTIADRQHALRRIGICGSAEDGDAEDLDGDGLFMTMHAVGFVTTGEGTISSEMTTIECAVPPRTSAP